MIGPFEENRVHVGDMLRMLRELPDESMGSLVTDPPYCSGEDPTLDPKAKYEQGGTTRSAGPTFGGDNRSQHAFRYWEALWLSECYRALAPGAYAMVFTDARMLPSTCDAFEAGGFVRRGIVVWDKTEKARSPHSGYFRLQSEFVVWGSKGDLPKHGFGPFPGVYRVPVRHEDKHHLTGKPTQLMRDLLAPVKGPVLDPFAGSGTTLVAARERGLDCLGFEQSPEYAAIANGRLGAE